MVLSGLKGTYAAASSGGRESRVEGEGVTPQGCPEWQLLPDKPKGFALPLIEVRVGAAREPRGPEGDPFHRSPSQWRPARSAVACALFLRPRVLLYGGRLNMGEV